MDKYDKSEKFVEEIIKKMKTDEDDEFTAMVVISIAENGGIEKILESLIVELTEYFNGTTDFLMGFKMEDLVFSAIEYVEDNFADIDYDSVAVVFVLPNAREYCFFMPLLKLSQMTEDQLVRCEYLKKIIGDIL
ncbi:MAG: hypothetical protein BWK75_03015 [Candidatus Altiarchaeales archaeon A3]|nr:MAG: hypothetical protein BWK75_03015 [Candidatus Altiarchaeales archaeon A3]